MRIILHTKSACGAVESPGFSSNVGRGYARSNAVDTMMATAPPLKIPKPCIANTAAMKAPRVFLLAYSDIIVADNG
jgi:hypothetical protein